MTSGERESKCRLEKMTEKQAGDIFENKILPDIGVFGSAPEHPTLIVVAGQPGSGKSTAIRHAELVRGATLKIIGDDFVAWVPGYHDLAKIDPSSAVEDAWAAGADYFYKAAVSQAKGMKANIIMELANPKNFNSLADQYRPLGYGTELHIVATPGHLSWTGVLDRTERALSNGHIGTNVICPQNAHDETYAGWPRAVFHAEEDKLYDRILIKRRDGTVVYRNHLVRKPDGTETWAQPARGLESLLQERHRAVSDVEAKQAENAWDRIVHSEHMKSDDYLKALPLETYQKQVMKRVTSEWSGFDTSTKEPGKLDDVDTFKKWLEGINEDLTTTDNIKTFRRSDAYEARIQVYFEDLADLAKKYRDRSIAGSERAASVKRVDSRSAIEPSVAGGKRKFGDVAEESWDAHKRVKGAHSEALPPDPSLKTCLGTSASASKSGEELRKLAPVVPEAKIRMERTGVSLSEPVEPASSRTTLDTRSRDCGGHGR